MKMKASKIQKLKFQGNKPANRLNELSRLLKTAFI